MAAEAAVVAVAEEVAEEAEAAAEVEAEAMPRMPHQGVSTMCIVHPMHCTENNVQEAIDTDQVP